jgi:hypothetical protein
MDPNPNGVEIKLVVLGLSRVGLEQDGVVMIFLHLCYRGHSSAGRLVQDERMSPGVTLDGVFSLLQHLTLPPWRRVRP